MASWGDCCCTWTSPGQPEVAMGAIGEGGVTDADMLSHARVTAQELAVVETAERAALRSCVERLQPHRLSLS